MKIERKNNLFILLLLINNKLNKPQIEKIKMKESSKNNIALIPKNRYTKKYFKDTPFSCIIFLKIFKPNSKNKEQSMKLIK
jgi:thiamine pyrophosphokinase